MTDEEMIEDARPTLGFAIPPFHVESFVGHSPAGWHKNAS
jgi:nitrogenase molybdenum-iron protein alpha/beta subunit